MLRRLGPGLRSAVQYAARLTNEQATVHLGTSRGNLSIGASHNC